MSRTMQRACAIALALVTFGVAAAPATGAGTDPDANRVLAVVNAAGGTMREVGDGYRLVLTGVVPRAVWFSDQPARATGSAAISQLVEAFFSGDDEPNAALEVFEGPAAGDVVVIELSNPRVRHSSTRLILDAHLLTQDDLAGSALSTHAERATNRAPRRFGAAALYIDDATSCLFGDGGAGGAGGTGGNGGTGGDGGTGGAGGVC